MGTKAFIQDQKFDTGWIALGVTSCPQWSLQYFDAVVAFLIQYINKRAPAPSVKVASVGQIRAAKQQKISASCGTVKGKIERKKYSREEYVSMSMVQCQQLQKLWVSYRVRRPQQAAEL